jgi:RNA polymerase sigma-70 factor (ECF subfamily)
VAGDADWDSETVRRLQRGDESALTELYDRYLNRLYLFALRLVGRPEDAEEIVAETFLKAFRHIDDYRGEGAFSGWLFRIADRLCRTRLRRRPPLRLISLQGLQQTPAVDRDPATREAAFRLVVRDALSDLPGDYQAVLVMRDVVGLTNREAAEALGRSAAAAKSLHFRARKAFRDSLAAALDGGDE